MKKKLFYSVFLIIIFNIFPYFNLKNNSVYPLFIQRAEAQEEKIDLSVVQDKSGNSATITAIITGPIIFKKGTEVKFVRATHNNNEPTNEITEIAYINESLSKMVDGVKIYTYKFDFNFPNLTKGYEYVAQVWMSGLKFGDRAFTSPPLIFIAKGSQTPVVSTNPQKVEAADCTIISAEWKPSGEQKDGYFKENNTQADIAVKTKDCVGAQGLTFTVYESDIATNDDLVKSGLANSKLNPPSDNFTIRILLGEENCDSQGSAALFGFDCDLFFRIKQSTKTLYDSTDHGASGALYYDCERLCNTITSTSYGRLIGVLPQGANGGAVQDVPTQKPLINPDETYTLLAPINGMKEITTKGGTCPGNPDLQSGLGCYLNIFFTLAIGICGVLAVIIIIISGIQYMGDESVFGKTEAKGKITSAILGLLIALGSYALLRTINPALTGENGVMVERVTGEIDGDTNSPIGEISSLPSSIICSGGKANIPNIAKSFNGKMTYSQDIPKGQGGPNSTIKLDCSGYVNYVLKCAGVPFVNSGTAVIFQNAEKVTSIEGSKINGRELMVGDLVGWRPGDNPKRFKNNGHVMIYVGNGQLADSHGPSTPIHPGQAFGNFPVSKYQEFIKYVKRAQ